MSFWVTVRPPFVRFNGYSPFKGSGKLFSEDAEGKLNFDPEKVRTFLWNLSDTLITVVGYQSSDRRENQELVQAWSNPRLCPRSRLVFNGGVPCRDGRHVLSRKPRYPQDLQGKPWSDRAFSWPDAPSSTPMKRRSRSCNLLPFSSWLERVRTTTAIVDRLTRFKVFVHWSSMTPLRRSICKHTCRRGTCACPS